MPIPKRTPQQRAIERQASLSRRRFLRGVGACIALPALESLLPRIAVAETATTASTAAAPRRMVFVAIPNGVNQDCWWPKPGTADLQLGPTMEPLAALKQHLQVIGGLDHINATAGADGAGDHARAAASLLTGCRAKKTSGADIHLGTSVDQLAAQHLGHVTRLPSLELTCDAVRNSGNCDSGYSCAYQFNISWRSATAPMPAERNPRLVFERLFGGGPGDQRRQSLELRKQQQRSILDFIRDDARSLARNVSTNDARKVDEYLTSVRDVEDRIARLEHAGHLPSTDYATPSGVPDSFPEHMRLMYDMIALALQTDSTRIATLIISHDGSNRAYPEGGVKEGHHELSHHQNQARNLEQLARIDKFHVQHFADFLARLQNTQDVDGNSVLFNSMIAYTGGNADGNAHSHTNLPMILAGHGGGALTTGRLHQLPSMPMSNMFVDMLEHMGVPGVDRFGDSDHRRSQI